MAPSEAEDWDDLDQLDMPGPDDSLCWKLRDGGSYEFSSEDEKACLDPKSPQPRFSKVYPLHRGRVVVEDLPLDGSPSMPFYKNPDRSRTIAASFRLSSRFESGKRIVGSGFRVAPTKGITAGHCLLNKVESDGKRKDDPLVSVVALEGVMVSGQALSRFGEPCQVECVHKEKFSDSGTSGADFGVLELGSDSPHFLLPCSSSSTTSSNPDVAIFSYPAVSGFMEKAEKELVQEHSRGLVWDQYSTVMARVGGDEHKLHDMLETTFGSFKTGELVCSVGIITEDNGNSLCTSCSTLRGSSGGPVCLATDDEALRGIHSGGRPGKECNISTSTDNPAFVEMYMSLVLPSLPAPDDASWQQFVMGPFLAWLHKHSAHVPEDSPWQRVLEHSEGLQRQQ